jgi:DNA-binding transcriptional MerR regulator
MVKKYTIQQMSELTGLSIHTLRYYENIGITPGVERSTSGYRLYSETDVAGLLFIKRLRSTGMPLKEIQRYVELYLQGDDTIEARRDLLDQHRQQLETSIAEMQIHLNAVMTKIAMYDQQCTTQDCSTELTETLIPSGEPHD